MELEQREEILTKIYQMYDEFIKDYQTACKVKCSACCTPNVTLTSLEAYRIVDHLKKNGMEDVFKKLKKEQGEQRFQPTVTVNQMANMCADGEEIPDEGNETILGACPILNEKECPIYEVRPFECRSFCSKINCEEEGIADMDSYVMTVNNIFKQFIEHIDSYGVSGNFTDMLLFLEKTDNKEFLRNKNIKAEKPLVPNFPARTVMIPPEHKHKADEILKKLQGIKLS